MNSIDLDNQTWLNDHAFSLNSQQYSFHVHNWGGRSSHNTNPIHRHSYTEICYNIQGNAEYNANGITHVLHDHSMILSPPGEAHNLLSSNGIFLLWIGFELVPSESSDEAIRLYQTLINSGKTIYPDCSDMISAQLWRMLFAPSISIQTLNINFLQVLSHNLLMSFFHSLLEPQPSQTSIKLARRSPSLLLQARRFIEDNLSYELSLDHVSKYLYVSPRHLSRIFTNELGISFSHYIRKVKVNKAMELFKSSELSIKQISEILGYDTVQYFTKIFSLESGITPGKYQASLHKYSRLHPS